MPHSLMADFESSVVSVLNKIYSDIPQVACLFHLSKNFFRCQPDIDLQQIYLTDPLFRGNTCMTLALSFVSVQNVILTFDALRNHCRIDEEPLFNYFEPSYIGELQSGDACCNYSLRSCGICIIVS